MIRRLLRIVGTVLLLGLAGQAGEMAALAPPQIQGPPPAPARGGTPRELPEYRSQYRENESKPRVTLTMVAAFVLIFGLVFVVLLVVFRDQVRELALPQNERELAASVRASGGRAVGLGPRETVFSALTKADGWVTPGRIALSAGMGNEEVERLLEDLMAEGRAKSGRDKQGRRLFRVAA